MRRKVTEIELSIVEERREKEDIITSYELMNEMEELDKECVVLEKKT